MIIKYSESRLGHPGYGWDAENLQELSQHLMDDKNEQYRDVRTFINELKVGEIQVINYTVQITISK